MALSRVMMRWDIESITTFLCSYRELASGDTNQGPEPAMPDKNYLDYGPRLPVWFLYKAPQIHPEIALSFIQASTLHPPRYIEADQLYSAALMKHPAAGGTLWM